MSKLFIIVFFIAISCISSARATLIYGTGQGSSIGGRDSHWRMVALPASWTNAPASVPYAAYIPTAVPGVFFGGGNPQSGVVFSGVTNY